ncbi:hypothetical protein EYZ11_005787 [Aspergillus tanneri]|uniref:3-dehydrosphinganine reductase n=1 Tax=Aspergillus tanneri TaxID=1220188 RepID=A0A4S3JJL4_9EURO|nr:hypothetical protein EYZ11_005787 [Aspergillus tanneri]
MAAMAFLQRFLARENKFEVEGKLVLVAGGSTGLGKQMALELAAKGANLLLLARSETTLRHTQREVQKACAKTKQIVDAIPIHRVLNHYHPPDILICTAGGTPSEVGFLADISPGAITSCIDQNYYSAVFIVQYCLKLWLAAPPTPSPRHILLTSSLSAFVGVPGYIAYTPTKVAIRALADTLRQELLMYNDHAVKVHVSFPGNFLTDSFLEEQGNKPRLTKTLEGTDGSRMELEQRLPTANTVAKKVIRELEHGKTYIPVDWKGELLLNNMRGPSPRFWTLWELLLGLVAVATWWVVRMDFDRKSRRFSSARGENV